MRYGSSQANIILRDVHRESFKLILQRNDPRRPSPADGKNTSSGGEKSSPLQLSENLPNVW